MQHCEHAKHQYLCASVSCLGTAWSTIDVTTFLLHTFTAARAALQRLHVLANCNTEHKYQTSATLPRTPCWIIVRQHVHETGTLRQQEYGHDEQTALVNPKTHSLAGPRLARYRPSALQQRRLQGWLDLHTDQAQLEKLRLSIHAGATMARMH